MSTALEKDVFLREAEKELKEGILAFWMKNAVDTENGGFLARMDGEGVVDRLSIKGSILNSRILWTFSAASRRYREPEYMAMANRAYAYMMEHFWDHEHGGLHFYVDCRGDAVEPRKQVYNLAFGIYALVEYHRASGRKEPFLRALDLFRIIEAHMYDAENKGYFEACSADYSEMEHFFAYEVPDREKKSMNTHLHVLEAYTQLYGVWKNERMAQRLKELIEVTLDRIVDARTHHFMLYFDEKWNSRTDEISFGHDIEGSWLLLEAAEALGDAALLQRVRAESEAMAAVALAQGLDPEHGGFYDRLENGDRLFADKVWWIQAEAVVGFLNAYGMTGDGKYYDAACSVWGFIQKHMIDRECGEWFWQVARDGTPDRSFPRIEPWKCPYHHSRACFEILRRLGGAPGEVGHGR